MHHTNPGMYKIGFIMEDPVFLCNLWLVLAASNLSRHTTIMYTGLINCIWIMPNTSMSDILHFDIIAWIRRVKSENG